MTRPLLALCVLALAVLACLSPVVPTTPPAITVTSQYRDRPYPVPHVVPVPFDGKKGIEP